MNRLGTHLFVAATWLAAAGVAHADAVTDWNQRAGGFIGDALGVFLGLTTSFFFRGFAGGFCFCCTTGFLLLRCLAKLFIPETGYVSVLRSWAGATGHVTTPQTNP